MSYKIEWGGEILSLRTVCKKEGISAGAVYSQIYRTGEDPKTVLLYFLNKPNKGNREKIEINGITADLKTHCKNLGVSYESVIARKNKTGESAKQSLLYFLDKSKKGNREKIELNGELLDVKNYCKIVGVNYSSVTYYKYVYPEMSYKDIVKLLKNNVGGGIREKIELNGVIADLSTHCKDLGVSYDSVRARVRETGESAKESLLYFLNQPNKGNREKIELNGKFITVKNYCKQLNYDYKLVTRYKRSQPNKTYTEVLKEWETLTEDEILNNIHLFEIWQKVIDRCYNPKNPAYKWYGGKKINPTRVYKKWQDFTGFKEDNWEEYTNHVKQYGRKQTSIDREDENGDYCPSNCSWGDWEQQGRNKSNTKYILPCNNYQKTLRQHCNKNGYDYNKIINYIKKYNLTPDKALAKYLKEIKNK